MGARLDLHTLRLFARTVELKNIAQAAAAEHIAASALSKRISDLEETLGTALLYRQRRGVEPTPAGLALLHHAHQILTSVDALELDLAEFAQGVRGHVRMLANISSIVQFLPADLSAFAKLHPDIKVDLSEAGTPAILKAVADGRADLGVIIGGLVDHGLATAPYREDRMVLVRPRAIRWPARPRPPSPRRWITNSSACIRTAAGKASSPRPPATPAGRCGCGCGRPASTPLPGWSKRAWGSVSRRRTRSRRARRWR
jgi:DNA-binding transcriptional LysR family regulator